VSVILTNYSIGAIIVGMECSTPVAEHGVGRFTQTRPCKGKVVVTLTTDKGTKHFCKRHSVYVEQYLRAQGTGTVTWVKEQR